MPSDLEQLVEMGFDPERAKIAVSKTGGLQGALEWLEVNQDKSLDEIQSATTQTNDEEGSCLTTPEKKLEVYYAITWPTSSESTEEITPIGQEEDKSANFAEVT
ncbi:hypothetical protein CIHG_04659 [Coccidioides immitis H538.4]|uniref:UBA domain-containing protein n=1 Tax=Coccidioides immitis H538.4 TaxID=396776 RepID=A0A0J8RQ66_COCIT|nr:hypothetical protein CIHG_04659 [Coccidioides immitis H538.4]